MAQETQLRSTDVIELDKLTINEIIKQAERISEDSEISDFLIFLLEAQAHLDDTSYSQSLIMSWVIIERYIYWLWNNYLKTLNYSKDHRTKLTDTNYWTIDFVLEGLALANELKSQEFEELMVLKKKRNEIVHDGYRISLEEAQNCLEKAKDIVKKRSGIT